MKRLFLSLLVVGVASAGWFAPEVINAQGAAVPPGQVPGRAGGAGAGGANPAARPTTGTGIILGQVVDASTGQPIPGATVSMTVRPGAGTQPARGGGAPGAPAAPAPPPPPIPPMPGGGPGQPPGQAPVIADGDGHFVFHDLPKGTVNLTANANGFSSGSVGQTRPNGPARPIDLGDGERISDTKIRLWKYAALAGMVLDEAGEPAVGVSVRAFRKTTSAGRPQLSGYNQASTDDRGTFRISQLTAGDYVIAIPQTQTTMPAAIMETMMKGVSSGTGLGTGFLDLMSSGGPGMLGSGIRVGDYLTSPGSGVAPLAPTNDGRLFAYQTLFYPAAPTLAQATAVALRSGEERTGLNFQLRVVPTARVSGSVTGPDGPAATIGVRLLPVGADELGDAAFDAATTATGADGSFMFLGVPPGQYIAKVLKQPRMQIPADMAGGLGGFAFGPGMSAPPTGTAALMLFAQAPVAVAGADVTGLSLTLSEGIKVSGRFVFDGTLQKPAPQQLSQFRVMLQSADGKGAGQFPQGGQPMTDQNGVFKTSGYPTGKYLVTPSGPVAGGWMVKSVMAQGRDASVEPLELKDADLNDVVITYTDKPGQIAGTVRATGTGVPPPSTVILFPVDYRAWMANGMSPRVTRTTVAATKTGAFTLGNLLAGEYLVAALDDRDVLENQDAAYFTALSRVASHVTLTDGEKKSLDLTIARIR